MADRQAGHRRIVWAVVALTAVVLLAGLSGATLPTHAGSVALPVNPIQSAAASLHGGNGPASQGALSCSSAAALTYACDAAAPATGGPAYSWQNVTTEVHGGPTQPVASMTYDAAASEVVLFGGRGSSAVAQNQTWTYAAGVWTNLTGSLAFAPPAVYGDSLAYFPGSNGVVLFGGIDQAGAYTNFTYLFANGTWSNLTASSHRAPSPRAWAAFTNDTTDRELVLFGGRSAGGWDADTWVFEDGIWLNITSAQSPALPPVVGGAILTNLPGVGALLFGGAEWGPTSVHPSTYEFVNSRWQNLTGTLALQPPAFDYGGGEYVPAVAGTFVFGGWLLSGGGGPYSQPQTWEFANGSWTNVTSLVSSGSAMPGELQGATAFVPADGTILSYGTAATNPYGADYLWAFTATPLVAINASAAVAQVGEAVRFAGSVSFGLAPNAISWSLGDGTTSALANLSHSYSHPGVYVVTLTATSLAGESRTASVFVEVVPALTVSIVVVPNTPLVGSPAGFAGVTWGGEGPYSFAWTFGDGASSTEAVPSHAYATAGLYMVRVSVNDALGFRANASINVTVTSPTSSSPPPPVPLTSGVGPYLAIGIVLLAVIAVMLAVYLWQRPKPPGPASPSSPPQKMDAT